ncbi:MAG: Maf family protein [Bacillota bacterium]
MTAIYLASASPRRKSLLEQIGVPHTVLFKNVDETGYEDLPPAAQVEKLALRKASAVAGDLDRGLVIGADTVVVWRGRVLNKPGNAAGALDMLLKLQSAEHTVYTGLVLIDASTGQTAVGSESTLVKFRPASPAELKAYIATGEPLDKAGAYGVQGIGGAFVESITGCYFNVVGLPLARLVKMLADFGIEVGRFWPRKD